MVNKVCCIHRVECYSAVKKNGLLRYATAWRNRKIIILSERSRTKKLCTVWLHLYETLGTLSYSDRKQISGYLQIGGVREWEEGMAKGKRKLLGVIGFIFSLSWLYWWFCGYICVYRYIYISTFIRINTLNMCSLLYFNYRNLVTEWMNCSLVKRKESIFSCQWWVLPKVLWLPMELTEHFGQVLSEEICLVLCTIKKRLGTETHQHPEG